MRPPGYCNAPPQVLFGHLGICWAAEEELLGSKEQLRAKTDMVTEWFSAWKKIVRVWAEYVETLPEKVNEEMILWWWRRRLTMTTNTKLIQPAPSQEKFRGGLFFSAKPIEVIKPDIQNGLAPHTIKLFSFESTRYPKDFFIFYGFCHSWWHSWSYGAKGWWHFFQLRRKSDLFESSL